jgi:hypothetical protein
MPEPIGIRSMVELVNHASEGGPCSYSIDHTAAECTERGHVLPPNNAVTFSLRPQVMIPCAPLRKNACATSAPGPGCRREAPQAASDPLSVRPSRSHFVSRMNLNETDAPSVALNGTFTLTKPGHDA